MAKKRRPRDDDDDDDEDRPRGKRRRDEEDDDEDESPRKRRRDEEDDDDDDDDDDDEDEDRPRKRRRSRDEEDDEDSEDEPEELSEEEQERELNRKKVLARTQLLALSEGMMKYRQRAQLFLYFTGAWVAAIPLVYFLPYLLVILGVIMLGWILVPQLLAIVAGRICRKGPPTMGGNGLLYMDMILCAVVMGGLFCGAAGVYLFDGYKIFDEIEGPKLNFVMVVASAVIWFAAFICLFVTFIVELFYVRGCARFLKDKNRAKSAQSVALEHILANIASLPVMGVAGWFAYDGMGKMGYILIGAMCLVYLLFVIKGYYDMMSVCEGVSIIIGKRIREDEKPQW